MMTKKQKREVKLAHSKGAKLQFKQHNTNKWADIDTPFWAFYNGDYRVKPLETNNDDEIEKSFESLFNDNNDIVKRDAKTLSFLVTSVTEHLAHGIPVFATTLKCYNSAHNHEIIIRGKYWPVGTKIDFQEIIK